MTFEDNPSTNPEPIDPNMYLPEGQIPVPETESFNPDDLLRDTALLSRVAYAPNSIIEAQSQGNPDEDAVKFAELEGLRRDVLGRIYGPAATAYEAGRIRQTTAEEAVNVLTGVRNNLDSTGEDYAYVDRIINELEGQIPTVNYHIINLENAVNNPYEQRNPEDLLHTDVAQIASLDEFLGRDLQLAAGVAIDIESKFVSSAALTGKVAEEAQFATRRAAGYRNAVQDDPSVALVEGMESVIDARGAQTVDEHERACAESAEADIDAVADIRDDAHLLSVDLGKLANDTTLRRTIEAAQGDQGFFYSVQQLRETLYHVMNGAANQYAVAEAVGGVRAQFEQVKRNLEAVRMAKSQDHGTTSATVERLHSMMSSEYLKVA